MTEQKVPGDATVLDYAPPPPPRRLRDSMEYYREVPALDALTFVLILIVFVAIACFGMFKVLTF